MAVDRGVGGLVPTAEICPSTDPDLASVLEWMGRDLTRPHEAMGRANAVCPFLARALASGAVWMASVGHVAHPADVADAVYQYLGKFDCLPPVEDEQLKSIVVVFPDVADPARAVALIDEVQYALKPAMVEAGFMIGELHPWNDTPPRANPESTYRPNRSPVSALAIRRLHPHDVGFLLGDPDEARARRLLMAYLRHLDWRRIPERAQTEIAARLREWLLPAG